MVVSSFIHTQALPWRLIFQCQLARLQLRRLDMTGIYLVRLLLRNSGLPSCTFQYQEGKVIHTWGFGRDISIFGKTLGLPFWKGSSQRDIPIWNGQDREQILPRCAGTFDGWEEDYYIHSTLWWRHLNIQYPPPSQPPTRSTLLNSNVSRRNLHLRWKAERGFLPALCRHF